MRCIFCKNDSSLSTSVEHIIPESLWNTKQILPRGIVCDGCNNYFARKVEKPFLDSPALTYLRFHEAVPNKRGRIPPVEGLILPGHVVRAHRHTDGSVAATLNVPPDAFTEIKRAETSTVVFPMSGSPPNDAVISRFLAKVAVEGMAQRVMNTPGGIDYIIDEQQFDPIRSFARMGKPNHWPHHARRIYDTNHRWLGEDGKSFQVVHEYDFLHTNNGELYFVLALYGLELTLNIGGPETAGFIAWLAEHENASPLHTGKNAPWGTR